MQTRELSFGFSISTGVSKMLFVKSRTIVATALAIAISPALAAEANFGGVQSSLATAQSLAPSGKVSPAALAKAQQQFAEALQIANQFTAQYGADGKLNPAHAALVNSLMMADAQTVAAAANAPTLEAAQSLVNMANYQNSAKSGITSSIAKASNSIQVSSPSSTALVYVPIQPCRIVETRAIFAGVGGVFSPGEVREYSGLGGTGQGGNGSCSGYSGSIPAAMALNVAIDSSYQVSPFSGFGFLALSPAGQYCTVLSSTNPNICSPSNLPGTSWMNYTYNEDRGNQGIAVLNTSGNFQVYAQDSTNVAIDSYGYFETASGEGALPSGTNNQTLRYDSSNALAANSLLQAFSDGGLLAGFAGTSAGIPATGSGVRMMWYPGKAAFRAGYVDAAQWDDVHIGAFSTAMGYDTTASDNYSTAMGQQTTASGDTSTAMGFSTTASGIESTAMGSGTTASGTDSTAMGFITTASGDESTAMGFSTTASGNTSTAMGSIANTNGHYGSFAYGDGSAQTMNDAAKQFMVRASGGFKFFTSTDATTGIQLPAGSGSWTSLSDRNTKTAVQPIDALDVLTRVIALPMNTWQYKTQDTKYRHLGPMAQDFYAAFHLGESDKGIDDIDAQGVALAAIQGLNEKLEERDREIAALRSQVASLQAVTNDVAEMKTQLATLRQSITATINVAAQP